MADSTITVVLSLAPGLSILAGLLINVFIVAVNISEWKKGRPVSTTDKVITSLGISRMVFQVTCVLYVILDIYFHRLSVIFFRSVTFLDITSISSSIWLSTLLSSVFCLKISTSHNTFFLWLKNLVLNRVVHLIIASVMVSISYGLIFALTANVKIPNNSSRETDNNVFIGVWISGLILPTNGPFIVNFMFSVLLIIYLYHHMSQMRSQRNTTIHLDIYYKTIKFTGFSLLGSTGYIIILQTYEYSYEVLGILGFYFLCLIFPTLHSIYLIYVTAKLRIQVSNMVQMLSRR